MTTVPYNNYNRRQARQQGAGFSRSDNGSAVMFLQEAAALWLPPFFLSIKVKPFICRYKIRALSP